MLSTVQRASSRHLFRRVPIRASSCSLQHFSTTTTLNSKRDSNDRLLVVGSGVAGSAAALVAAEVYNIPVTLVFAGESPANCNSYWAQGGIIYRNFDPNSGDSAESLSRDIHTAGAGLCQHDAVSKVAMEGPSIVEQLLLDESGSFANVPFDRNQVTNELSLCLGRIMNVIL
jgi:L-aspartate oxidase